MYNFSLHKIKDRDNLDFDPSSFSRFKFGDALVAKQFGTDLARGFISEYLSKRKIDKQIVIFSSPYAFIPTATFAMKNYFIYELNKWLSENEYKVVEEAKIFRTVTYKEDYGELSAIERLSLIGNDRFYIDKTFAEDKVLIFFR